MTTAKRRAAHPNRIPFEGVLTRLDEPSDKSPEGAQGRRVILTKAAAEEALDSLIDMAVNFETKFHDHNVRNKCGVITHAFIEGNEVKVEGHIYGRDFPEVTKQLKSEEEMGLSYDLINVHVADMRQAIWTLTKVTFTGAAIILRNKAAYRKTRISIRATSEKFTRVLRMSGRVRIGCARRRSAKK